MRRGLSLIELLVVIAILAVLLALLLPAVQRARECANRTRCCNNLKQMGLAVQDHIALKGYYPPAWVNSSTAAAQEYPGWGWGAILLPWLDQGALFGQLGLPGSLFGGGNSPAQPNWLTETPLPVYRCPSDYGPAINDRRYNHALSNYRAVLGPGDAGEGFQPGVDGGGAMGNNSTVADIPDGAANTVMLGECAYDAVHWAAIWPGMAGCDPATDSVMVSCVAWQIDAGASVINGPAPQAFGSWHPGGALFSFCDGSVRFFPDGGNVQMLMWLAGRSDGQVVSLGF